MSKDVVTEAAALLDAWRGQGADRVDPLRFHFIEALARRASGHEGEARRVLDEKLAAALEDYARDVAQAADASEAVAAPVAADGLTTLVDLLSANGAALQDAAGDMAVLDYFRGLWAELRVGRELRQALENVPENAGPLNSLHLVHQSLMLMHDLAPGYLRHFLSYADTLSWMERMSGADLLLGAAARAEAPKKGGKGKPD
ncbi:DUF2894 domain-containing protein [Pigmentiphaga sp. GD03639]|uniref:DUF2894 domain-containing protein n=1 Tax=Pigmentiphaga sp. GD03639 TaxID=2975354 RepID=UPI00244705F3|nr:DUF2894 domain-containing protein [Pigmentiphaga sp. GD03639]MDH2238724.1 DUF2894 domain-containing protein [Pigmentiphaga sp. GD03639]